MEKSCPACSETLIRAPKRPALMSCSSCGGVWTDNATSKEIIEKLDLEIERLAHETAARGPKPIGPRRLEKWSRKCPECNEQLAHVEQASTSIDVCAAHGTFFDRDELAQVIETLRRERGYVEPEPTPSAVASERAPFRAGGSRPVYSPARDSSRGDTAGAVILGLDLLSELFD